MIIESNYLPDGLYSMENGKIYKVEMLGSYPYVVTERDYCEMARISESSSEEMWDNDPDNE